MLKTYNYRNRKIEFTDNLNQLNSDNIFTIIVGKNGTGKSRLLAAVVKEFLNAKKLSGLFKDYESADVTFKGGLSYNYLPEKIITVSTSPFDRFYVNRRQEYNDGYSYLGIRDLMSHDFGLAYLSKIIASLIEAVVKSPKQMSEITTVLNYLGYTDKIWINFQSRNSSNKFYRLLDAENPIEEFENITKYSQGLMGLNRKFFYNERSINKEKVYKLIVVLKRIVPYFNTRNIELELNRNGIFTDYLFQDYLQDLVFLMQSGVLRLRDVGLEKINTKETYSIKDASSGEQSVIIGFLGIASQITDNSLICIDEPEICLHPEWQEKYIKYLISTFKKFKGCHFIIATHSPQIISNLESHNCFVLKMETGKVTNAKHLNNHSVDFQLATVFDTPGYKNEYLGRIAVSILSKVAKSKKFDSEDLEGYDLLTQQAKKMEGDDPLINLISLITNLKKDIDKNNA